MTKLNIIYESISIFNGDVDGLAINDYKGSIELEFDFKEIHFQMNIDKSKDKYKIIIN